MAGTLPYAELLAATALVAVTGLRATAARVRLGRKRVPTRRLKAELSELELAHLLGGPALVADTVIIRMRDDGRLEISPDGRLTVLRRRSGDPVEAELVRQAGPSGRARAVPLRRALTASHPVRRVGARLVERGLLHDPRPLRAAVRARRALTAALALGALLGAAAWVRLLLAHHPVLPTLGGFVLLLALGALWRRATAPGPSALTPSGRSLLERLRAAAGPAVAGGAAGAGLGATDLTYAVGELTLYDWYTADPSTGAADGSWSDPGGSHAGGHDGGFGSWADSGSWSGHDGGGSGSWGGDGGGSWGGGDSSGGGGGG
ncbi:TIGR04222 domain-containing membrane protein [Kitasatospora sp. NPDC004289]